MRRQRSRKIGCAAETLLPQLLLRLTILIRMFCEKGFGASALRAHSRLHSEAFDS